MKKKSIKAHFAPYSIYRKRKTTINHAFASAIAPSIECDGAALDAAIRSLGQDPDGDLQCVYCDGAASTWDHLVGLVAKGEFRGHGHQIGNLVPCCGPCNSEKGAKDWGGHLRTKSAEEKFEARYKTISDYSKKFSTVVDPKVIAELRPEDWERYGAIREQILALMKDADEIASRLRNALVTHQEQSRTATTA